MQEAPPGVLEQNALERRDGERELTSDSRERGRRGKGRVGAARKKGGAGGNNGRNFNFSNFAKKPTGDGVVGEGRGGTGSDTSLSGPQGMKASDLRSPSAGGRGRLGAHLPWGRWCGGREPGDSCTNTSSKWGVSRRAQRAGSMVPGRSGQRLRTGWRASRKRTAAPAFLPSFPPRGPWRRRAAAARDRGGCSRSARS